MYSTTIRYRFIIEQWKNFSLHAREVLPLASEKRGERGSRGEREKERSRGKEAERREMSVAKEKISSVREKRERHNVAAEE